MRNFHAFLPTLAGLGLLGLTPGLALAADSFLTPRPEQVPADVPVADLGQSSSLDPSIPFDAALAQGMVRVAGPPPLPAPDQVDGLAYPLAVPAIGLDPWGWRFSEARGRWRMHTGLDLMAPRGTPVLAVLPGRVHLVQWIDGYGVTVVLDHGDGRRTLYAHLDAVAVRPAQDVRAGDVLAAVGMTGRTSGPHLHFELRHLQGGLWVARDPTALLPVAVRSALSATAARGLSPRRGDPLPMTVLPRESSGMDPQTSLSLSLPPQLPPLVASDGTRSDP